MLKHACHSVMVALLLFTTPVHAGDDDSYRVLILKGGGTIKQLDRDVYVDTKRTRVLNALAEQGWEVVSVLPGPGIDHTVYLRRR